VTPNNARLQKVLLNCVGLWVYFVEDVTVRVSDTTVSPTGLA